MANTWGDPHEGILEHIFSYLQSFADRASCACVCRQWCFYAREKENTAPPLLPCLLRPSISGASCFHFFSGTITSLPTVPAARFCGSMAGGWFVVARDQWRGYALLHLASGTQIPLPQVLQEDGDPFNDLWVGLEPTDLIIRAATAFPAPSNPDGDERYFIAAITFGEHKAAVWQSGMERWTPLEPYQGWYVGGALLVGQGICGPAWDTMPVMYEELEDVIFYCCPMAFLDGFFFLTSEEHLMLFVPYDDEDDHINDHINGELVGFLFPGQTMASPPVACHVVAARYLVESEGNSLLMVKRFVSPCLGQLSLQVFTLVWDDWQTPRWEMSSPSSAPLVGKMLFVGRGCSRAIRTGRNGPAFIYFLDDAVASPYELLSTIIRTEKEYRCSDMGWCRYDPQYVGKGWPEGPPADCSPWIWLYH